MADIEVRMALVSARISSPWEEKLTCPNTCRRSTRACRCTRPRGRCRKLRSKTLGLERYVGWKDVEHENVGRART